MAQTAIYNFGDVQSDLIDFVSTGSTDAANVRRTNRAIENSYREVTMARHWSYYYQRGRLQTQAPYNTGTITYTQATRVVDLASGTWPTWAANGTLSIAGVEYEVATRTSGTQLVLSVNSNPGADVAAGTSYYLWQDTYVLPVDFQSLGTIKDAQNNVTLEYMEPNDFIAMRLFNMTVSQPRYFTIFHDQNYVGALAIKLFPPPMLSYSYDYMYKRHPRQFTCHGYTTGTVTTSGTSVTGVGTTFTQAMIGCMIRFGTTGDGPTGTHGENPYVAQRVVSSFTSATSIGIDTALDAEVAAVKYEIGDPIDIEAGSMYTAFLRRCEYELAVQQRRDDIPKYLALAEKAMLVAFEEDNRNMDRRPEGSRYWRRVPLYYDVTNATT